MTFRSMNVADLTMQMQKLIANPAETHRIGQMAKARVAKNYSWIEIAKDTDAVYKELVTENSSRVAEAV